MGLNRPSFTPICTICLQIVERGQSQKVDLQRPTVCDNACYRSVVAGFEKHRVVSVSLEMRPAMIT
jgi:hypothetical protein